MNPIPRNESESDEQFVYTLADRCFAYLERHGEDAGEINPFAARVGFVKAA